MCLASVVILTAIVFSPRRSPFPASLLWTEYSPSIAQMELPNPTTLGSNALPAAGASAALNVVLFYTDDWNADVLGVADKTGMVQTPNLDQLAAEGQWFPHSYVTTSVCWQSRATLLTGLYVSVHQFFRLNSNSFYGEVVRWTDTLFALLKEGGQYVGFVGKWHASFPNATLKAEAFDFFRPYYGLHWMRRGGVLRHVTELNQADALEFLKKRPVEQNFALTVSFFATHAWNSKEYPDTYMPQPYSATYP